MRAGDLDRIESPRLRALLGRMLSGSFFGRTLVRQGDRLDVRVAPEAPLERTQDGLRVAVDGTTIRVRRSRLEAVPQEPNLPEGKYIAKVDGSSTDADRNTAINAIIDVLREAGLSRRKAGQT